MTGMIGLVKAYWILLSQVGDARRLGREIDLLFRHCVLEVLTKEGLFEYLKTPRSYGQVLAEFGYVDHAYTRMLFAVLREDAVVNYAANCYHFVPNGARVKLDDAVAQAEENARAFASMAEGMADYIPQRLRNAPVELSATFEADGRQLMTKFDATLGDKIYTQARRAVFALIGPDMHGLRGKKLLEIGCGSGRETAELWAKLNGDIQLTAIDPVASLLELAQRHFGDYLQQIAPDHPPISSGNQPVFELVGATELPYENASFDAVFHAFVLHWTPDPKKAIQEIARVLKPGGLVFGLQPTKPAARPYFDLVVQTSENAYGYFWTEEFKRWYADEGLDIKTYTPLNLFCGRKDLRANAHFMAAHLAQG